MFGNSGYYGQSRSVRSAEAIEGFEVPLSMIKKSLLNDFLEQSEYSDDQKEFLKKQSIKNIKCIADKVGYSSWHHTGKYYNRTYHYNLESICDFILENKNNLNDFLPKKEEKKEIPVIYGFLEVSEWGGTRNHPKYLGTSKHYGVIKGQWLHCWKFSANYGKIEKFKIKSNRVENFKEFENFQDFVKKFICEKGKKRDYNKLVKEIFKK